MYENGELHPGLLAEKTRNWGAALEGDVVIPRSAIGLNAERTILYFALSNDTTPRIIADGMRHAGASDIAQLDVNWPYPRFLVFRRNESGRLVAAAAVKTIPFDPDTFANRRKKIFSTSRALPIEGRGLARIDWHGGCNGLDMHQNAHRRGRAVGLAVIAVVACGMACRSIGARELDCVDVWGEARYRNYGYDHVVHLRSRCPTPAECAVSTNVNPERIRTVVPPGQHVEVLTFRGSPAREFIPRAECTSQ
jgi:hypothetical protein